MKPYLPTFTEFVKPMNSLLKRVKKGEKGLLPELILLETKYVKETSEGWVDWENDVQLHLKCLRYWVETAEKSGVVPCVVP